MEWRERRNKRKQKESDEKRVAEMKKVGVKVAKTKKIMSGKALFVFDPTLFQDAEDAADTKYLKGDANIEEKDELLEAGGKNWGESKTKKEEVIDEEENEDDIEEENKEGEKGQEGDKLKVDEDAFDDEEELPDDIE